MREILFRGKSKHDGKWVYGDLVRNTHDGAELIIIELDVENNRCRFVQVEPESVGEFTGLTDEDGNYIFEGDIVEYTRTHMYCPTASFHNQDLVSRHQIYHDEEYHQFRDKHYSMEPDGTWKCIGSGSIGFNDERADENICFVIGNIYDNPELLKGGAK